MKPVVSLIAIAAAISGCATTQSVSTIELEKGRTAVFQIPTTVISGNISRLSADYAAALGRASSYRAVYRQDGISQGVQTSSSQNTAMISYVKQNDRGILKNNYVASFILDAKPTGDTYTVTVACPSSLLNDVSDLSGPLPWSPFIQREKVVADVNSLCAKAAFTFQLTEGGEINTSFNDSSVFANFTRKLKSYSPRNEEIKAYDLEKSKWFYLSDNNKEYKIAVSVFPYRNGSKVTYRNVRDVTCRASQPCEFDPTFGERLKARLTAIAND